MKKLNKKKGRLNKNRGYLNKSEWLMEKQINETVDWIKNLPMPKMRWELPKMGILDYVD